MLPFQDLSKGLLNEYRFLNWVKILMKTLMTSQRLTKGLKELVKTLITFMVSIRKITYLNLCFPAVRKTSPQTNYD